MEQFIYMYGIANTPSRMKTVLLHSFLILKSCPHLLKIIKLVLPNILRHSFNNPKTTNVAV